MILALLAAVATCSEWLLPGCNKQVWSNHSICSHGNKSVICCVTASMFDMLLSCAYVDSLHGDSIACKQATNQSAFDSDTCPLSHMFLNACKSA